MKRELIKDMYIKSANRNIEDICTSLGITRANFYYHKNADKKKGIDWDELKLLNAYDKAPTIENEKVFLSTLINEFEKALEEFKDKTAENKLSKLERFAASYYRLKMPRPESKQKINKAELLKEFLMKVAQVAIDKGRSDIVDFLAKNEDELIEIFTKE